MGNPKETKVYPLAYLSMGNGDLMQVTDFTYTIDNKGKQVHTQRREGAGVVKGKSESEVTFNFAVDEDGVEHDYVRLVQRGTIKQIRVKCPGGDNYALTGMFTKCVTNGPLEDAVTGNARFIASTDPR